ncbi:MAG: peptidase S53 [Burkholderiaceae bacterium]|nr:peptidase S53 [Burkholderiaceae bacterium]
MRAQHRLILPLCVSALVSALLAACGGGAQTSTNAPQAQSLSQQRADAATGTTTFAIASTALSSDAAGVQVQPKFHVAPVVLDTPDDRDAAGSSNSTLSSPHLQAVPESMRQLSTRRLTLERIRAAQAGADGGTVANATAVTTYTPAQIRAAYGLPTLPSAGTALTAAQAAQLGAGQTIYIVDAQSDPNVGAELAAFNQKFGLPTCSQGSYTASTILPLAAASGSACQFYVAAASASGGISNTAPAYDSGWATEIALDVQWAHATAPLARIVLIETADASVNNLSAGIKLANAMGPGVVSMSFGAPEGNWTASANAVFSSSNMSYLAATGDNGEAVQWPAVSPVVLAVGGTTLTYSGSGARSETAWSDTGGGISAYTAAPSYQARGVPGITSTPAARSVADVAFNADPSTGEYLAVISAGSSSVNWLSAGGTSLATPQWAGLVAVANAMRAQAAKSLLGAPHTILYGQIASTPGNYASAFDDVVKGADGACSTCGARTGYDEVTGLGTPNGSSMLSLLSGATIAPMPPSVASATINGQVGVALSFTVSASAPDPLTYSLSGAPSGMAIASTGVVTWSKPVAGTYSVVVTAKDSKTGLSGQGTYQVVISAAVQTPTQAPVTTSPFPIPIVIGNIISGEAGSPLSFGTTVIAMDAVSYSLSGAPAGMSISSTGVVSWSKPVAGTYSIMVTAKDNVTGLSGEGLYAVIVAGSSTGTGGGSGGTGSSGGSSGGSTSSGSLTVTVPPLKGTASVAFTGSITISDPSASNINVSLTGVPLGIQAMPEGTNIVLSWADPVAGSYNFTLQVSDSNGHTVKETVTIVIAN